MSRDGKARKRGGWASKDESWGEQAGMGEPGRQVSGEERWVGE